MVTRLYSPSRLRPWIVPLLFFAVGAWCGASRLRLLAPAQAEVRELTSREAFLSGGERSEIVLREITSILKQDIVTTLKQMDTRLARIETASLHEKAIGLGRPNGGAAAK